MQPQIVAIVNLKGGVGKTTTTFNLAGAWAARGRNVLCLDLDPVAALSLRLFEVEPTRVTLSQTLLDGALLADAILPSAIERIAVVPSDKGLKPIQAGLTQPVGLEQRLKRALGKLATDTHTPPYDWILIDCPPSLDRLTLNALVAARWVLVPFDPANVARGALMETLAYVNEAKSWHNPQLNILGLLACSNINERTANDRAALEAIREAVGNLMLNTTIPTTVKIREAGERRKPLAQCPPGEYGACAALYDDVRRELETRIKKQ